MKAGTVHSSTPFHTATKIPYHQKIKDMYSMDKRYSTQNTVVYRRILLQQESYLFIVLIVVLLVLVALPS